MSTNKFKLEVGKFYKFIPKHYLEIVYQDPSNDEVVGIVRLFDTHERFYVSWWDAYTPMEEIPNPRMTSTTPTTVGTNWLSPLTDFYGKMEEVQELLEDGLISEEKAMSIMKQCQRQLEAKDKTPPVGNPMSTWFPPIVRREDAPFDTDDEAEEDGCGSDGEYLDNLLEEEKKRFVGIGSMCEHEWVDTGFHKSWCKKCDANKPEGEQQ